VARYTADGIPDVGFGVGGLASASSGSATAVAVQADGNVVVAGTSGSAIAVMRFNAIGGLDSGFGTGGTATASITNSNSASTVVVLGSGRIVVAGTGFSPHTGNDFEVARFTASGVLDTRFGSGGGVTTNFEGRVNAFANSIARDYSGNILVAGATTSAGDSLSLARYRSDGQLDTNFGDGGTVQITFNPYLFGPRFGDGFVAVQRDNKILLVGTSIEPGTTNYDFALARLLPDGSLDTTFGNNGRVTTFSEAQNTDFAPSGGVLIQPDGKIVVAGYLEDYGVFPYIDKGEVVRYNLDGSLDTTFGTGGRSSFTIPSNSGRITGLALEPGGKILLGGYAQDPSTGSNNYLLERLDSNGSVDTTFGTEGQVLTSFSTFFYYGAPFAVRPDGRILAGGTTFDPVTFQRSITVAQFTANGAVDTQFGTGGQASVQFGSSSAVLTNFTLQRDGKLVVVGTEVRVDPITSMATAKFALARLTATGRLDTTFGTGGTVTTRFNGLDVATAVLVLTDGTIWVAGRTQDSSLYFDYALAEYDSNGHLVRGSQPRRSSPGVIVGNYSS
jgi:uncharacterized delta-60 repeat protein